MHPQHETAEREAAVIRHLTEVKTALKVDRMTAQDVQRQIRAAFVAGWEAARERRCECEAA